MLIAIFRATLPASVLILFIGATATRAQDVGHATVTGVVHDSLVSGRPLARAEVVIEGTGLTAITDERGRFRIDHATPGHHRITFFHAMLDSLAVGAGVMPIDVPDSGSVDVRLATPSAPRLRARSCGAQRGALATGVIVGHVRSAEDESPLVGALVAASWSVWSIGATEVRMSRCCCAAASAPLPAATHRIARCRPAVAC